MTSNELKTLAKEIMLTVVATEFSSPLSGV